MRKDDRREGFRFVKSLIVRPGLTVEIGWTDIWDYGTGYHRGEPVVRVAGTDHQGRPFEVTLGSSVLSTIVGAYTEKTIAALHCGLYAGFVVDLKEIEGRAK